MNAITTTDDKPSHDEVIRVLENSLYPGAKRGELRVGQACVNCSGCNGLDADAAPGLHRLDLNQGMPDAQS